MTAWVYAALWLQEMMPTLSEMCGNDPADFPGYRAYCLTGKDGGLTQHWRLSCSALRGWVWRTLSKYCVLQMVAKSYGKMEFKGAPVWS